MQRPQSNLHNDQAQPTQPAPATPSTRALRSWVKPTFERVPLNDAQAGGPVTRFDGTNAYSFS